MYNHDTGDDPAARNVRGGGGGRSWQETQLVANQTTTEVTPPPPGESPRTPPSAVAQTIARAARRVRLRLALYHGATGLLVGSVVSGALVGLLRANVFTSDALPGSDAFLLLPPLGGAVLGGLVGAARRVDMLAVARLLDERLDLKERLSTSYALRDSGAQDAFVLRQREDAESHAGAAATAVNRAIPLRPLPKHGYIALGLALAVFLGWLLPTLPVFQSPAQKAEKAALKRDGERLVRIAKALEKSADAKNLDGTRAAAKKIEELGQEMQRGKLPRQKAMMKLAKLTEEMKAQQQAMAAQSSPRSLPAAGRDLEKALAAANALPKPDANEQANGKDDLKMPQADGQQNGQKNSDKGVNAQAEQAIKKSQQAMAQNDVPGLAEQLSKLADQISRGEPKDPAERERLSKQMEAMAKALEKTSLSQASEPLKKAAEALRQGQNAEAAEQLREAARRAQEGARQQQDAETLRQSAEALMNSEGAESEQGQPFEENGEGMGEGDAFDGEGNAKGSQQGNRPGQGQGKTANGDGPGEGKNGIGSGHQAIGTNPKQTTEGRAYADPEGAKSGMYDGNWRVNKVRDDKFGRVYAPDGKTPNTRVQGKRGDKGKESVSYFRGTPDKVDASTPYYDVYERYAPAAENAINREDIPVQYRDNVRAYFNSLRPSASPAQGGKKPTGNSGGAKAGGG